jgi:hypothetical protein
MTLINLLSTRTGSGHHAGRRAGGRTFRPSLDDLESRTVLSAAAAAAAIPVPVQVGATSPAASALNLNLTGLNITNVTNQAGQLVASGLATLSLAGHTINNVPITLTATPAATTGAQSILHLSLGPVNLNLLGLGVKLDNCANGPVTVDLTAIPSTQPGGGLLGDLLIGISNLLNPSGLTSTTPVPTGLAGQIDSLVNDASGAVLNGLNSVLSSVTNALATPAAAAAGSATSTILDLHLNPINLDLLGADVTTSAICLTVTATSGSGNLLGNLLNGITHLLDPSGTPGIAGHLNSTFRVVQDAQPLPTVG